VYREDNQCINILADIREYNLKKKVFYIIPIQILYAICWEGPHVDIFLISSIDVSMFVTLFSLC